MKKVTKFVLVLLAIALVAGVYFFGVKQEAFGGITVLSISDAKYVAKSSDLNYNDAFLLNVVVNKGGESLVGAITPEMISQYGIKYIPEGTFTINMNLKDVSCNYVIKDDATTIYKIYQATARSGTIASNAAVPWSNVDLNSVKSACRNTWSAPRGAGTASVGAPIAGGDCNAIVDIQTTPIRPDVGAQASEWSYAMLPDDSNDGIHWRTTHIGGIPWFKGYTIDTVANPRFTVDIIVTNSKGNAQVTTLDETQSTKFIGDIGRAKFVGSLLAQQYCGVPGVEKKILKNIATDEYTVVSKQVYDDYKNTMSQLLNFDNNYYAFQFIAPTPAPSRDPGVGADSLWLLMSTLNSDHRLLATESISDNCVINNMIYSCTPEKDIIYPQLQLILKADWVGIVIPEGRPEIVKYLIPTKAYSGDVNILRVTVKNTGLTSDSFDTTLVCNRPVTLGNVRSSLDMGEEREVYLNYGGDPGNYNCTLTSRSVNNPLNYDQKALYLTLEEKDPAKPQSCERVPTQPCDKALWQGYPVCSWNEQFCEKQPFNWTWVIVGFGALMVLGIVAYYLQRRNSGRIKPKRRNK